MFLLLKNAELYSPEYMGLKDVLVCGEKVIAIEDAINGSVLPLDCQTVDLNRSILAPGFIDQHIHLIGGGGEGGFASRTPEVQLSKLTEAGTTTVVGVMGTDGNTRAPESLFAKVKSLEIEGITAYMHTGSYEVPIKTITGAIRKDMVFVDKVLGVKIALADHRCSFPTTQELARIVSDLRIGSMISGKKGLLHIHMGGLDSPFGKINELLEMGLPIHHFSPTHVARKPALFEEAIAFGRKGGFIDITSGGSQFTEPAAAVLHAVESGVPYGQITLSSDGNGSLPCFDQQGKMVGLEAASVDSNLKVLPYLLESGFSMEQALGFLTANVADSLGIDKGRVKPGSDADFVIFDQNLQLNKVYARGRLMVNDSKAVVFGTFE